MTGPNGRFKVVQAPVLQPAVDWFTRTPNGPFIDTGSDLSVGSIDRGRIYLSKATVYEMAEELGLFDELKSRASASEADVYNRGYDDAIRDNHADSIRRAALDLADLAGSLLAYAGQDAGQARDDHAADVAGAAGGASASVGEFSGKPVRSNSPRL